MIDISQMTTRTALDDFAMRFINEQTSFVADKVLPYKYVTKSQSKKYQYDSSMLKQVVTKSSSKASANAVDYGVFTSNINTTLHKLRGEVDPKDEANADRAVADIKMDQSANIQQRLLISREISMVTLVTTSTNYPSDLTATLSAGDTWLDPAGDPEEDSIDAANAIHLRCGRTPNACVMAGTTLRKLRKSPAMRERIKYTNAGVIPLAAIKEYLGVEYLNVCDAVVDSAVEGATKSIGDIFDDSIVFYVYNPSPAMKSVSFGHTWIRKDIYTHEWIDEERGGVDGRIEWVEQGLEYEQGPGMIVGSGDNDFSAGFLLKNVV